jgi:hypothetical protein
MGFNSASWRSFKNPCDCSAARIRWAVRKETRLQQREEESNRPDECPKPCLHPKLCPGRQRILVLHNTQTDGQYSHPRSHRPCVGRGIGAAHVFPNARPARSGHIVQGRGWWELIGCASRNQTRSSASAICRKAVGSPRIAALGHPTAAEPPGASQGGSVPPHQ